MKEGILIGLISLGLLILAIIFGLVSSLFVAAIVWWVWNNVVLIIAPLYPAISYWQMFFLVWALSAIASLFKNNTNTKENRR